MRIVVQYPAGSLPDSLARVLGNELSNRFGTAVFIDNRPGATGVIATNHVAKSAPDGYTLLMTIPAPVTTFVALYKKLSYDPRTELRMVSDIAVPRVMLAVHPSMPASDVRSLLAAIRAAPPDSYAMGSWGIGSQGHLIQAYVNRTYGMQVMHVAYRSEGAMVADLLSGALNLTAGTLTTFAPHIKAGTMKGIAILGTRRSLLLPDLRTFDEQGFSDPVYALEGPISLMAPARTPDAIVERLGREVQAIMSLPETRNYIQATGADPIGNSPAEAEAAYRLLLPVTLRLARESGVTLD